MRAGLSLRLGVHLSPQPAKTGAVTTPPANTVAPAVTGTAEVGETLTTTNGTWSGTPTSYAYQWQRDNGGGYGAISGATSSTYLIDAGDVGYTIRCRVSAANAGGSTAANSNATATVPDDAATIDPPELTLTSGTDDPPVVTREIPANAGEGDYIQRRIDTADTYDTVDLLEEERVLVWDGTDFIISDTVTLLASPFTIQNGLDTGTPYFMSERFRRDLGDDDLYSDWSDDVTFTLAASAVNENVLLIAGDSISDYSGGYQDMFEAEFPAYTVLDYATGGWALANLETDLPNALAEVPEVTFIFIGANDQGGHIGAGVPDYYDRLVAYAAAHKAQGTKVVVATVLPQGSGYPGYTDTNTARAALNPLIKAGAGTDFDYVCDWDASPMGQDSDANDAAKYPDDLHPSVPVGQNLLYPNMRGATLAAFGVAHDVAQFTFADEASATASTVTESNAITIQGLAYGETKAYSVSSGHQVRKRTGIAGSWGSWTTDGSGTVTVGDGLQVRATSSGTPDAHVDVVLTVGGISDTFRITTEPAVGNTMVMNSADKAASLTLSGGDLTVSQATDPQVVRMVRSTIPFTGKRYAELTVNSLLGVFSPMMGVCNLAASLTGSDQNNIPGNGNTNGGGSISSGGIYPSGTYAAHGGLAPGDVLMLAVDEPNDLIWMGKNGTWATTTNPATGTNGQSVGALAEYYLWVALARADNVTVNTGGSAFAYTPPSGFTAMP
jgi:hypothetical protein